MAKKIVKKAVKKTVKKAPTKKAPAKKLTSLAKGKPKKGSAKKTVVKRAVGKKAGKVIDKVKLAEKDLINKEANIIASADRKKKTSKRPVKSSTKKQTNGLLDSIIEGMKEKKAKNITVIDLEKIENRVADFFVICDADSNTHVNSIADGIEETVMKLSGEKPYHSEGHQNSEWILIDYINIVVHVFQRESREYYNIEGLWGDAEIKIID